MRGLAQVINWFNDAAGLDTAEGRNYLQHRLEVGRRDRI